MIGKDKLNYKDFELIERCVINNIVKLKGLQKSCKSKNMDVTKVTNNINLHRRVLRKIIKQREVTI